MTYLIRRTFNGHRFWIGNPPRGRTWTKKAAQAREYDTVEAARAVIRARALAAASVVHADDPHGETIALERIYRKRKRNR
jgi:hypothetical protein